MDAFDVLGLAPSFDLDPQQLEQRYRDLQRALHPDRFVKAQASERRASLARAVSVNDAYRALRDELKRAQILIARHGGEPSEPGQAADPALLMEVMELREALADAKTRGDEAARRTLTESVTRLQAGATEALRAAFAKLAVADVAARDDAARALSRLRYYRRFLDEVSAIEDALEPTSSH
jgi:molecular chaperone HscB